MFDCPLEANHSASLFAPCSSIKNLSISSQHGSNASFLSRPNCGAADASSTNRRNSNTMAGSEFQITGSNQSLARRRKANVQAKMIERKEKFLKNKEYKMSRKDMVNKVSIILQRIIEDFSQRLLTDQKS